MRTRVEIGFYKKMNTSGLCAVGVDVPDDFVNWGEKGTFDMELYDN